MTVSTEQAGAGGIWLDVEAVRELLERFASKAYDLECRDSSASDLGRLMLSRSMGDPADPTECLRRKAADLLGSTDGGLGQVIRQLAAEIDVIHDKLRDSLETTLTADQSAANELGGQEPR